MKVIMKAVAGSHLFGLNTEKSDKDYKGVFIPSTDDLLLGNSKFTHKETTGNDGSRNTASDVDVELFSLHKFMDMLAEGQTAAFELLFTPEEMIIEKTAEWDWLQSHREEFVHKKVSAFIGYAKQNAARYGIRGSRMGDLEKVIETMKTFTATDRLSKYESKFRHLHNTLEYFKIMNETEKGFMIEVLGKKYDSHCAVDYVLKSLELVYNNYGERSKSAKENNNIDWKAVSHAVRVMIQGKELLDTGHITLPLRPEHTELLLKIKKGEMDFVTEVQPIVESRMQDLLEAEKCSKLPLDVTAAKNAMIKAMHYITICTGVTDV